MSNLYLLNFTTLWRLSRSVMGWLQLNSWWQIFTLISKGELQGILLGMITWLVVQLKTGKRTKTLASANSIVWRLTILHNPEPNSEPRWLGRVGGRRGGGRRGLLLILKEKALLSYTCYWPKWYLFCIPGLKCCISFNCCKHTFFYQ